MRFPAWSISLLFVFSSLFFATSRADAQTTWHVDDDACPGPGTGTEADPFCRIQNAIDTSSDGDQVVVHVGTYLENINYLGKAITVRSSDPEDPDTIASTIIDGSSAREEDIFGSVVTFINGETSDSLLNGLTLRGGIGLKFLGNRFGGAVYADDASPTINNCVLMSNTATSGGGLSCFGEGADPVISDCTISSNTSRRGGGIFSAGSSPQITRCWILDNTSEIDGGAFSGLGGSPIISNCIIAGNVARSGGALALSGQSAATVHNSTIVANEASIRGGAIFLNNASPTLRNCISWGNTAPSGPEFSLVGAVLSVDYCDVQGGQEAVELLNDSTLLWGVGNIDTDPLFLGTQPRNEHLSAASPCVDTGDPLFMPGPGEKDIDGDERVINLIVDMGADEYNPDCNGNGIPDEEDITNGTSVDCNNNGVPDECLHLEIDCNDNALPDQCDIEMGASEDCNDNGVPDECLYLEIDCNENAVPDQCDIDQGTSDDCDSDGQPDDCEPDCNENGVNDECDISNGSSDDCDLNGVPDDCGPDCNNNGILDLCDISDGTSEDCSGDGIPDECDPDCNDNGEPDSCDIEAGLSEDINRNGVPDECEPLVTLYVDDAAAGQPVQDGTAENPFATIGQALDAAPTDQALVEVVVADGIYLGDGNKNLDFEGKILTLRSVNGPQSTIIDCQGAGRGFVFINFETRDAILDGFTIKNGRAKDGGAIRCKGNSNPTIRNCILIDNISDQQGKGGGLYATSSSPLITHCVIVGNIAESTGRGGGGIFITGHGIDLQTSIENSLIVGNTAYQGGGVWTSSELNIRNCTIARNAAANQGGGIYVHTSVLVRVSNCILWGDEAAIGPEVYLRNEATNLTVKYSDVQGGQAGVEGPGTLNWETGNIDADPLFTDAD